MRTAAVALALSLVACRDNTERALDYGAQLGACTMHARERFPTNDALACEDSIACENRVRAKFNRPPRDPAKGCQ